MNRSSDQPASDRCRLVLRIVCLVIMPVVGIVTGADDSFKAKAESTPVVSSATDNVADGTPEIPSFYVRSVTGPLAGKSVCYVCRNGDRPVVMVLLRKLDQNAIELLKSLDRTVNDHRADGLRCFAVLLTGSPQKDSARLQTIAFDSKLEIPLAVAGEAVTNAESMKINSDDDLIVLLYENRRVVQRFIHRDDSCNAEARKKIISAAEALSKGSR